MLLDKRDKRGRVQGRRQALPNAAEKIMQQKVQLFQQVPLRRQSFRIVVAAFKVNFRPQCMRRGERGGGVQALIDSVHDLDYSCNVRFIYVWKCICDLKPPIVVDLNTPLIPSPPVCCPISPLSLFPTPFSSPSQLDPPSRRVIRRPEILQRTRLFLYLGSYFPAHNHPVVSPYWRNCDWLSLYYSGCDWFAGASPMFTLNSHWSVGDWRPFSVP